MTLLCLRSVFAALLTTIIWAISSQPASAAVQLERVEVYGSVCCRGGGAGGGGGSGSGSGKITVDELWEDPDFYEEGVWVAKVTTPIQDVRCLANGVGAKNTVSTADLTVRLQAALAIYRGIPVGLRKDAIAGGVMKVTYADGGTENWPIPAPTFSDGGLSSSTPFGLVKGGGVPVPKTCLVG